MQRHHCGLYGVTLTLLALLPMASMPADGAGFFGRSRGARDPGKDLMWRGAAELEAGHAERGIALTLEGLAAVATPTEAAAGHANLCAGYAMLRRWDDALAECDRAIDLDRRNWRSYNNRAAVFVGRREYQRAIDDVNAGLELAPGSPVLMQSLEIVREHQRAERERRRFALLA